MKTRTLVSLLLALCAAEFLWAADGTWIAGDGDWSAVGNWQDDTPAGGTGSTAFFTAGAGTVTNDVTDLALLGIQLGGTGFTLAGNTLTLDSAGFLTVLNNSHAVLLPVSLSGDTAVTVASGQSLTLGGVVSGDGGMTLTGGRIVLANANTYAGITRHITGIVEIDTPDALGDSSTNPTNLVLGEGTFRYTGPSATMDRGYTMIPGVSSNRAVVIDVTNANTTLTIAGKVVAPGGSFIKTGEGTVAYTYPGYQELNKSKLANKENGQITYDVNGVAATNEYAQFTVEKGRMILGAPGQTNLITTSSGWVGCKTLASPRLDIIGGMTRFINGYFTIGRGTGTTASPQSPSMYINNGAYVTIEGSGLVMDNGQGLGAIHRCRPLLDINSATLRVDNDIFLSEDGNATSVVNVANSGVFISNSQNPLRGMCISQSAGAKTDVTFDGGSTGTVYMLRVGRGGLLNVIGNSVFEMDGTPTNAVTQLSNLGTARFSGGLLKQRTAKRSSDWFARLSTLLVGADNMTVDVSSHAWMDASAKPDPASPGGKIIKTGLGTLAPRATGVDIQADAGRIAMSVDHAYVTNGLSGTLTMAAGTALEVSGANALADMTVTPGTTPLIFLPHSLSSKPDLWRYNGYSMRRWDGLLRLTPDIGGQVGSVFMYRKFKVNTAWKATFAYLTWSTGATPADGVTFALHNDPRGAGAIGTGGANLGYAGAPCVTNSVGVGIDVYLKRMRFGRQGYFLVNTANDSLPAIAATPVKTRFTVSYDGTGLLTVDVAGSDPTTYRRFTYPVDVAAEVGGTEAYVGFAAGTGGSMGQHSIADFTFENGATPPVAYCRHGGKLTLAGGATLNALLQPSAQQNGFVFGKLAYGDQSVIDIAAPHAKADVPVPTLADQGLWKLNGVARWKSSGGLALSTNAVSQPKGSAFMTNRYPIAGSWVARFGYDLGLANATPADYFTFALQNSGITTTAENPNPGLSLMWRYYDGAIRTTQLKIYTNGTLMTVASTNIVPVDLKNGIHANFSVAYDAPSQTLTVSTSQEAGTNVTVITGIDLMGILKGVSSSYIGFTAATGGSYAENIITDFSFTGDALSAAWPKPGYLAFDKMSGSGTLVKRGSGALGLMGDAGQPTSNVVLRLENGGLVLRKNSLEPLDLTGARSEWIFSALGLWAEDGALQVCPNALNVNGTGTSARRVCVSNAWTATFSFLFGANSNPPADAFAMFFHNDPRGPGISSGNTATAGFAGMANSLGLRWCFYPGHPAVISNKVSIGRNGTWNDASGLSYLPVVLKNGATDFVVKYNPGAATLTAVLTQGANVVTNIFSGVNIPADVGGNHAFVGFGGGTGGAAGEMRIRDFRLTYDQPVDALADQSYLANLILPAASTNTVTLDTSVPEGTFKVAAATIEEGAVLGVETVGQPGTLTLSAVTQSGAAEYPVGSGCTLALTDVTGGNTVTKSGGGTLTFTGAVATYAGDTVLTDGTLTLDAARLPTTTDLHVTSGATLNLAFTGKQYIHALYVDGFQMPGGVYNATKASWITGPGTLVVTYPPVGTMLFLK